MADSMNEPHGPLFDGDRRLIWDATTISAFQRNPYLYYQFYVRGRRFKNVHPAAAFGTAWHTAMELYWQGNIIQKVWDKLPALQYEPYGPHSKFSLLRALVWYDLWDKSRPQRLGKTLAIEQPFCYDCVASDYKIAGCVDQVVEREDGTQWIVERKTGAQLLTAKTYLKRYRTQLDVYTLHGLRSLNNFGGIVIDALQTAVTFNDFARFELPYGGASFNEDYVNRRIRFTLDAAEQLSTSPGDDSLWALAARYDDPYCSRDVSDILSQNPCLWDRLFDISTTTEPLWYPGVPR